jgi:hypothetical protein
MLQDQNLLLSFARIAGRIDESEASGSGQAPRSIVSEPLGSSQGTEVATGSTTTITTTNSSERGNSSTKVFWEAPSSYLSTTTTLTTYTSSERGNSSIKVFWEAPSSFPSTVPSNLTDLRREGRESPSGLSQLSIVSGMEWDPSADVGKYQLTPKSHSNPTDRDENSVSEWLTTGVTRSEMKYKNRGEVSILI